MPQLADTARLMLGHPPKDMKDYPKATEAWEVWTTIQHRRLKFADEFVPQARAGVQGWRWEGSMREAVIRRFGGGPNDWLRHQIVEFLKATGNGVALGHRGPVAYWWFPAEWQNVRPETARLHAAGKPATPAKAPQLAAARQPQQRAAKKPQQRPTGRQVSVGPDKCRFCTAGYKKLKYTRAHERAEHPNEYRAGARFICPVGVSGEICDEPFNEPRAFGKHLVADHHIGVRSTRDQLAGTAMARARQQHALQQPATKVQPPAAEPAAPALAVAAPPAAAVVDEPLTAAPAAAEQPAEAAPASAAAAAEEPGASAVVAPRPTSALEDLAAEAEDPASGGVTAADAARAMEVVLAYLRNAEQSEAEKVAELAEERRRRAAAEHQMEQLQKVLAPALEFLTAPSG